MDVGRAFIPLVYFASGCLEVVPSICAKGNLVVDLLEHFRLDH